MKLKEKLGEPLYQSLLTHSIIHSGNRHSLYKALLKLKNNEGLCIATLGGSITEGADSLGKIDTPYLDIVSSNLSNNFYGKRDIHALNLGKSCTYSFQGLIFTESYLLDFIPDIVFVEYAVNESLDSFGIERFESLIRKLLKLPHRPAIIPIILFTKDFYSCSTYMTPIGIHYNLPVINLLEALKPHLKNHTLSWDDYSFDTIHPHQEGHQLIADCIIHYLKKAQIDMQKSDKVEALALPPCRFSTPYENLQFLDAKMLFKIGTTSFQLISQNDSLFPYMLYNLPASNTHYISFNLTCKALIFLFIQHNDLSFATATVTIDEAHKYFLQGYSPFSFQIPFAKFIMYEDISKPHQIQLTLSDLDADKTFYLIGVAWC